MEDMFAYCHKLITVNVSSFDTSNTKNMRGIFHECHNLKYLDLSNFNTSSVNSIGSICFENKSIVYIKFNLLKINEGTHYDDMFSHSSSYLKICINNEDSKNKLPLGIKSKINCLHDCFIIDDVKIDLKNNLCIKYCNESDNKYELNNICYEKCPNTSYFLNDNEYLCLDKS